MLVAGLLKLFVNGASGVTGMLQGIGFPIPGFFAWVLILSEILFGIAILADYKLKYTVIPPIIIMIIAGITVNWGRWSNLILHLVVASNYWLIAVMNKK